MAATGAEISQLRELYRQARTDIAQLSDPFERDVGLAALRLEATHAYRELQSTAVGMDDASIAPLKDYVLSLTGGDNVEALVQSLDREAQGFAKKVLQNLWVLLTTGVLVGVLGVVTNIVLAGALAAESFGAALFGAIFAGGTATV